MEKYESKQVQILRPASMIYNVLSRFDHLSPILADKVEAWSATEDTCSFQVKGFSVSLRMQEREPYKLIKVEGETPMNFTFWIQLVAVDESDTRMRVVLHVHLNAMMKMMIGGKLSQAVDQIAQQIAEGFNKAPI